MARVRVCQGHHKIKVMSKKRGRKEGSEPPRDEGQQAQIEEQAHQQMTEAKDGEQPMLPPPRRSSMTADELRRLRHREVSRKSRQRQRDRETALRASLEIAASENTDLEALHRAIIRSQDLITDTHLSPMVLHQVNSLMKDNHELRMRIIRESHIRNRDAHTHTQTHIKNQFSEGREQKHQGSPSRRDRGPWLTSPLSDIPHDMPSNVEGGRFVDAPQMYHAAIDSPMTYTLNVPSPLQTPPMLGQMMDPHAQLHPSFVMHQAPLPMPLLYPTQRLDAATIYTMTPSLAPYSGYTQLLPHHPAPNTLPQLSPEVRMDPLSPYEPTHSPPSSYDLLPGLTSSFPPTYTHTNSQPPDLRLSTDSNTTPTPFPDPNPFPHPNPSTGATTHGASMPECSYELYESISIGEDEDSEGWGVI